MRSLLERIPLVVKVTLSALLIALPVWMITDALQTRYISDLYHDRIAGTLERSAREHRLLFDRHLKSLHTLARITVGEKRFLEHISSREKVSGDEGIRRYAGTLPPWLLPSSLLRSFAHFRFAVLFEGDRVVEVYQDHPGEIPRELDQPSNLLRLLSANQLHLTEIGGRPYVITSEGTVDHQTGTTVSLLLATPIDDKFLIDVQGMGDHGDIIALVGNNNSRVLVSSREDLLPTGIPFDNFAHAYFTTGKSFFDYGASDIDAHLVSLVPTTNFKSLVSSLTARERRQRALLGGVLFLTFTFTIAWILGDVRKLAREMDSFSETHLGAVSRRSIRGDELAAFRVRFTDMTEEILLARERQERDTEEKIRLEKENIELEAAGRQVRLLQSVMEHFHIGVIMDKNGSPHAGNSVMEIFEERAGGLESFDIGVEKKAVKTVGGRDAGQYIFEISRPEILPGEKLTLVQDVTRRHELEREMHIKDIAVASSINAIVITDLERKITYANDSLLKMWGHEDIAEVIGRLSTSLWADERECHEVIERLQGGGHWIGEMKGKRRDGSLFDVQLSASLVKDGQGAPLGMMGSFLDITPRKVAEEGLRASLREKEVLLRELHHRVKNNLQIISSMMYLQSERIADGEARELFIENQDRIRSMVLVHEQLYQSESLDTVEMKEYLEGLLSALSGVYVADSRVVNFSLDAGGVSLDVDQAITCGLIVNELVTNSLKHAFAGRKEGKVEIEVRSDGQSGVHLTVRDDGQGLPDGFRVEDTKSLGLKIVDRLVGKLGGSMDVEVDGGARFRISFPGSDRQQRKDL